VGCSWDAQVVGFAELAAAGISIASMSIIDIKVVALAKR
jgi:hypothetical protein